MMMRTSEHASNIDGVASTQWDSSSTACSNVDVPRLSYPSDSGRSEPMISPSTTVAPSLCSTPPEAPKKKKTAKKKMKSSQLPEVTTTSVPFVDLPPTLLRRATALDALWAESLGSFVIVRKSDVPMLTRLSLPSKKDTTYTPLPESEIPAPIKAFLDTLTIPLGHLARIFVDNGFDSDVGLDLLCQLPPDNNWEDMKNQIIQHGRLVGWLAIRQGLEQRQARLRTAQH